MNIPWKLKSSIFKIIDTLNTPQLLYFLQRNVTRRSRITNMTINHAWAKHKKTLEKYKATKLIFEFGAGKNLAQNLFLSASVDNQLVVDLNPMIELNLVETARSLLAEKIALRANEPITHLSDLSHFGIVYNAPFDAAKTNLQDASLDACISTNTLEHISRAGIENIFLELHRTLKDEGIVSAQIDYSDHYAHTDPTISLLNYLKFSEAEWRNYNHDCHYQNRLRHYNYLEIFKACGFVVVEEELAYCEKNIPNEITTHFKNDDIRWSATSAHMVLKKKLSLQA